MFTKYNNFLRNIVILSFVLISFAPCCEVGEGNFTPPKYICNSKQLRKFVQMADKETIVYVDTEFSAKRICLIQIATSEITVLIDPLDKRKIDLRLLRPLFENNRVLKVFHACQQDIILLNKVVGVKPAPVFDTQQAALLIYPKTQLTGLAELANNLLEIEMNKDCQCSDWEQRPLSTNQLNYAANDVIYLRRLYPLLRSRLEQKPKWYQWAFERSASIGSPKQTNQVLITLSAEQKHLKEMLGILLKDRSQALHVAPQVLATSREIDMFIIAPVEAKTAFLTLPYRGEFFWEEAASIFFSSLMLEPEPCYEEIEKNRF